MCTPNMTVLVELHFCIKSKFPADSLQLKLQYKAFVFYAAQWEESIGQDTEGPQRFCLCVRVL